MYIKHQITQNITTRIIVSKAFSISEIIIRLRIGLLL